MSSRTLLKLNWTPESIPTAWGLITVLNYIFIYFEQHVSYLTFYVRVKLDRLFSFRKIIFRIHSQLIFYSLLLNIYHFWIVHFEIHSKWKRLSTFQFIENSSVFQFIPPIQTSQVHRSKNSLKKIRYKFKFKPGLLRNKYKYTYKYGFITRKNRKKNIIQGSVIFQSIFYEKNFCYK